MKTRKLISFFSYAINAVLNSYSMLFFSNKKWFAVLIIVASFFNPFAGVGGIVATIVAVLSAYGIGFNREEVSSGLYTYSAALLGMGMGTFYETGSSYWILLSLAAMLSVLISAALIAKLGKSFLPALSLAFILTFWIVILASKEFSTVELTERNIYWLNEMYANGGGTLISFINYIENISMPDYVAGFLRSLSAIIFQGNLASGIILAIGILCYSRISFSLMIIGYSAAMYFMDAMGAFTGGVNYYNLGTNFMLVAAAVGGFYVIPSVRSYLWSVITVIISYLLVIALGRVTATWGLPVFSLPFCVTVILFLYCLQLRHNRGKLILTPIQYYSPELNLYRYLNGKERLMNSYYNQLFLPYLGEWMVSQGYNGSMTHKGDWQHALDFVVLDEEMKTYKNPGSSIEDFYCYDKPVLAPADGTVQEIIDQIDDNEIGGNNAQQNWGNTIVIKHREGLYTKLSHLKKGSFRVYKGSHVRKGDIIAYCGNSGRSPEPHLHFQVQSTPYVGSKTLAYPLSYFLEKKDDELTLKSFSIPQEGSFITNINTNYQLHKALNFQPGFITTVSAENYKSEQWEVVSNVFNETYFYCKENKSYAYFINNGTVFYFTNYFGKKDTLLYYFYLAAYKVLLSSDKEISVQDELPIINYRNYPVRWLHDFIAPFYLFIRLPFKSTVKQDEDVLSGGDISFTSSWCKKLFGSKGKVLDSTVRIENGQLKSFTIVKNKKTIAAICSN